MSHDTLIIASVAIQAVLCIAAGLILLASWTFFRKPGVRFWKLYSPIWRWQEFVTPTGFYLWAGGIAVLLAIVIITTLTIFT